MTLSCLLVLRMASQSMPQGVLLNMQGHVGVYLGGGQVIEATTAFRPDGGVQRTTINMQKWTDWYRHSLIQYGGTA